MNGIPFQERKSALRGLLDLATGRYPRFLFRGNLGHFLPVFHFHEAHPDALEPYLQHLTENGYTTVDSDTVATWARRGIHPGPRTVALCFDDAWASLWTTVAPLLRKYDARAITFVSPQRITDAPAPRTPWPENGHPDVATVDRSDTPYCTWPELRALHDEGRIDIQAHTLRHAQVSAAPRPIDFVQPGHIAHGHDIPWIDTPSGYRMLTRHDLGAPWTLTRSRMSSVRRWIAPDLFKACTDHVAQHGQADFFERPHWRRELQQCAMRAPTGRWETDEEQVTALREELGESLAVLRHQLKSDRVKHMCFPWAVAGPEAITIAEEVGYETAYSDRLGGFRAVRKDDPPYQLMRLKHPFIYCLPGKPRTWFFGTRPPSAERGLNLNNPLLPDISP